MFDAHQVDTDALYVGIVNRTDRGWIFKNSESIGYLVPVSSKPFSDTIASIEADMRTQEKEQAGDTSEEADDIVRPQLQQQGQRPCPEATPAVDQDPALATDDDDRTKHPPDTEEFLKAFRYGDNLSEEQLHQVQAMLLQHRDCFAMEGDVLGLCNRITHSIDTVTDEPVVSAPYRIPKSQESAVKEIVQKMLDQGLIQKSNSEYSSPVVLVEKPDKVSVSA